jgi:hypothetical protein
MREARKLLDMRRPLLVALSMLLIFTALVAPRNADPVVHSSTSAQAISTPEDSWWMEQHHLRSLRASRSAQRVALPAKQTHHKHVAPRTRTHKPTTTRSSTGTALGATDNSVWYRLARCESGGNWADNTGNGYYGGLQFSLGTWHSVGGVGYPHQASAAEQIKRGKILQARSGWGQWPACSRKLGLR